MSKSSNIDHLNPPIPSLAKQKKDPPEAEAEHVRSRWPSTREEDAVSILPRFQTGPPWPWTHLRSEILL